MNGWSNKQECTKEWINEKWMNERMNEWMNEWMNECTCYWNKIKIK